MAIENGPFRVDCLFQNGVFHNYVSLPEGRDPSQYMKNALLRVIPTMANHDKDHRETSW